MKKIFGEPQYSSGTSVFSDAPYQYEEDLQEFRKVSMSIKEFAEKIELRTGEPLDSLSLPKYHYNILAKQQVKRPFSIYGVAIYCLKNFPK